MLPETPPFADRKEAGRQLARLLSYMSGREDLVVVGLAPAAIPVAAEVAEVLEAPLDVLVVRPLIVPGPSQISIGAVTSGGIRSIDEPLVARMRLPAWAAGFLAAIESSEAAQTEHRLREGRSRSSLGDRRVVIVDDGLASSNELKAAVAEVRLERPARIFLASPVLAAGIALDLRTQGVETDCLYEDEIERRGAAPFWYSDPALPTFSEVRRTLEQARRRSCPQWAAPVALLA